MIQFLNHIIFEHLQLMLMNPCYNSSVSYSDRMKILKKSYKISYNCYEHFFGDLKVFLVTTCRTRKFKDFYIEI
jgi:hypothetical protein